VLEGIALVGDPEFALVDEVRPHSTSHVITTCPAATAIPKQYACSWQGTPLHNCKPTQPSHQLPLLQNRRWSLLRLAHGCCLLPAWCFLLQAYPYIAKRLLTDESPRLQAALRWGGGWGGLGLGTTTTCQQTEGCAACARVCGGAIPCIPATAY
jgi:hypothetical protein